jgi:hypothetical protein
MLAIQQCAPEGVVTAKPSPNMTPQVRRCRPLRPTILIVAIVVSLGSAGAAAAQSAGDRRLPPEQGLACPPDVKGDPPTVGGGGGSESLSDKLAESKGVICPPSGVDRQMQVAPPNGGRLKVIPPPGTPGGDQSVQPK